MSLDRDDSRRLALEHTHLQRQLGRSLRDLREHTRMHTTEVAVRVKIDVDKLNRIERGQPPTYHELCAMLDAYGLLYDDWKPYLTRLHHITQRGWWRGYGLPRGHFAGTENDATLVREFQLGLVPEPLQTEPYIRVVLSASRRGRHEQELAIRLRRQQRLTVDDPRRYHVIIDETALAVPLPDPAVARDQLRHILTMAALPTITVQVMLRRAGPHEGRKGTFMVLSFPDPEDRTLLYVPHVTGATCVDNQDDTAAAELLFQHLSTLALTPTDSTRWIERLIAET
ncbi:helix-turn-helix domain-containing protein [Solihabitans fulvus]|uniref:Helix-turn-helix domain-containing protein n=1 Tax=Solihabitans fulvus TaxID=1892852 RepID=A0A5B2X5F5_9PSEU|nr:helix-turn-helix transcriptional regulator [Solihabitans fulvus]KAA2258567.1 helix-turn-helix domain-containing protein [Solihabitans fulvus]